MSELTAEERFTLEHDIADKMLEKAEEFVCDESLIFGATILAVAKSISRRADTTLLANIASATECGEGIAIAILALDLLSRRSRR